MKRLSVLSLWFTLCSLVVPMTFTDAARAEVQLSKPWEMFLDCRPADGASNEQLEVTVTVVSEGQYPQPTYREHYLLADFKSSVLEHGQPYRYTREAAEFKLTNPQGNSYDYTLRDKVEHRTLKCVRPLDGGATGSN